MKIFGVDPGTARVGWAFITEENGVIRAPLYGCLTTSKEDQPEKRLLDIFDRIHMLILENKPDVLAIEELFFTTNAKTIIPVAQARGIILLAAANAHIPVVSYTPLVVKQTMTGNGRAEKSQVQLMVKNLLHLDAVPKPDDTADAIAIALTHTFSYKLQRKII